MYYLPELVGMLQHLGITFDCTCGLFVMTCVFGDIKIQSLFSSSAAWYINIMAVKYIFFILKL